MPLYDYDCPKCRKTWEIITKRDPEQEPRCQEQAEPATPSCEGILVRRLIQTGSNFSLRGSGWYASDYPKKR